MTNDKLTFVICDLLFVIATAIVKSPATVTKIFDTLDRHHPNADTELVHRNAFELLVATILSAQSTDARVNLVTPALFARYPDARALAGAKPRELEKLILSTGFFRQKSKSLIGMASMLVDSYDSEVPADMEALTTLPGVGRKTANVVLGHALGVPGLPVDRHVLRVSNRIGLVKNDDPVKVEAQLCAMLPPERWTRASDALILHGRRICRPKPICKICNVRPDCDFYRTGVLTKPINRKIAAQVIRETPGPQKAQRAKPGPQKAQRAKPGPQKAQGKPGPQKAQIAKPGPQKAQGKPGPQKAQSRPEPQKAQSRPEPQQAQSKPEPQQAQSKQVRGKRLTRS